MTGRTVFIEIVYLHIMHLHATNLDLVHNTSQAHSQEEAPSTADVALKQSKLISETPLSVLIIPKAPSANSRSNLPAIQCKGTWMRCFLDSSILELRGPTQTHTGPSRKNP